MGKKYIIELEDKPFHKGNGDFLYRVKGFNSLVFDKNGVGKLTPYTEPDFEQVRKEAYEDGYKTAKVQCNIQAEKDLREVGERHYHKGLSDAWDAARKICAMDSHSRDKSFGAVITATIIEHNSASEAIEKIRQYEQEKEFKVGDEFENESGKKFVVLKMNGKEIDRYIDCDGKTYLMDRKYKVMRKTGRTFSEIATVLEKMREGQEQ